MDDWTPTYNLDSKHIVNNNNNDGLTERYEMPSRLDWNVFRRIYDTQPQNYEQLISVSGIGPGAIRALSLIGEIIFGTKASWQDPVKYNFAHGGKDGVPYHDITVVRNNTKNVIRNLINEFKHESEQAKPDESRLKSILSRAFSNC